MEPQDNQVVTMVPEVRYRTGPRWNRIFTSAALAVLAVLAWQTYDSRQDLGELRASVARHGNEAESNLRDARALTAQRETEIKALQTRLAGLEARVQETEGLFATVDDLHTQFSRAREERALAEVAQAMDIAAQQLQLAGNVSAALAALQSADARLAQFDQARVLPVRKLLARDIERLRTLPLADVPRLALQIEALIGRVDTLPLGFEREVPGHAPAAQSSPAAARSAKKNAPAVPASPPAEPAPAPAPGVVASLMHDLWREFRALVRIERLDQADTALLAPQQTEFLRANLRLRLLSARVALLQRENRLFADDIAQARAWVQRYFDGSAPLVAATVSELDAMARTRLDMTLPSLEETQTALRNLKPAGRN
ncbi:MAG: uroporphyrinogen-III C-methyltransferase [Candidatus Dactylopiibacterium sp.]|nr:uroporphyrinogen-III C-methyltransferase [Candidatus Dactylopiibacterium sp.]